MREKRLIIQINKPIQEVFDFLLNPQNTPLWITSLVREETSEWPVKVSTIYRNQDKEGSWGEYRLASLDPNKMFEMIKSDNNYHVRYTFKNLNDKGTELKYYEWVEKGELENPFTQDILEKLKVVIEGK